MKTAVYGGSFDPVHNGHLYVAGKLKEDFERVIIVPAYIAPFKRGERVTDASLRLQMLRPLCEEAKAELYDDEVKRGGTSYSADTLRRLMVNGQDLFFVIGGEELRRLNEWKDSEWLKKNVVFYVVPRPGFEIAQTVAARRGEGYRLKIATFAGPDISSAEVKAAVAFGREGALIPDYVRRIIQTNLLYRDFCKFTAAYPLFKMKPERIEHTYRAVKAGINLAKRWRTSLSKTTTALILHDIGKYTDAAFLNGMGIKTAAFIENIPAAVRHAYYSRAIAAQYFKIEDTDVLDAVENHSTGKANMDTLSKVVALADYIESGRDFAGVDEVRSLSMSNIDAALCLMLRQVIQFLQASGQEIYCTTIQAYDYYNQKGK